METLLEIVRDKEGKLTLHLPDSEAEVLAGKSFWDATIQELQEALVTGEEEGWQDVDQEIAKKLQIIQKHLQTLKGK